MNPPQDGDEAHPSQDSDEVYPSEACSSEGERIQYGAEGGLNGGAPPKGGGGRAPGDAQGSVMEKKRLTRFNKSRRGGSGATVQESKRRQTRQTKRREGSDRANKTNK